MPIDLQKFWQSEMSEHAETLLATRENLLLPFNDLLAACAAAVRGGHKILFFGNGGSAADAQHLATELTVRYKKDRAPIAALALTTDSSALTALGNDMGFDQLFARQVAALGRKGDIAIGITTSGNSPNVLNAFEECRRLGITTVCMTGRTGGKAAALSDILINVPSSTTARIQEMHIILGHMLCGALEVELGLIAEENIPLAKAV